MTDQHRNLRLIHAKPVLAFLAAFTFIFLFYVLASSRLTPILLLALPHAPGRQIPPASFAPEDLPHTLYWVAIALLGGAVSLAISLSSVRLLRRYLSRRTYLAALIFLILVSVAAAKMSFDSKMMMVELPRTLTCGTPPNIAAARGFLCGNATTIGFGDVWDWPERDWSGAILRLKVLLNILHQSTAILVLGTMLAVTSASRTSVRPERYQALLAKRQVILRLLAAGGVTLSGITLTDIVFANWPIHAVAPGTAGGSPVLAEAMTALSFYYAALGSIVLALALVFSRMFAAPPPRFLSAADGPLFGSAWQTAGSLLLRPSLIKALIALSPVLTAFFGNPLVQTIIESLDAAAA